MRSFLNKFAFLVSFSMVFGNRLRSTLIFLSFFLITANISLAEAEVWGTGRHDIWLSDYQCYTFVRAQDETEYPWSPPSGTFTSVVYLNSKWIEALSVWDPNLQTYLLNVTPGQTNLWWGYYPASEQWERIAFGWNATNAMRDHWSGEAYNTVKHLFDSTGKNITYLSYGSDPNAMYPDGCPVDCQPELDQLVIDCGGAENIAEWDPEACFGYCKEDDAQNGIDRDKKCVEKKNFHGDPINIYNGNHIEPETDIQLNSPFRGGFALSRHYNSRSDESSALGYGWTHSYSASLITNYNSDPNRIKIIDETGRGVYFQDLGGGSYVAQFKDRSTLELSGTNYIWHRLDEKKFTFNADGQLISIEDEIGNSQSLAYDANGRLETITDNAGNRVLKFQYDASGVLTSVTDAAGSKTWVSYGSTSQNLTSVTYGDGSGFTYEYNDANDPHNMTKKLDKMGHFISSWAYDAQDRATDNTTRDGRGVVIDYDTHAAENKIKVTDAYGKIKFFTIDDSVAGKKKITNIEGDSGCSTCGDEVVRIAYNTDLRVTEIEYANSRIDKFENFDTRGNAQTEIQDFGAPNQRTITYTYHPNSFRKLSQTEASVLGAGNRETIWDFDNDYNATPNENPTSLVSRVIERGFTQDATGATVAYEYITTLHYNAKGQLTSIDGPLPGSQDTTTYSYDPVTGNLLDVTLPLVGATSFSNYDAAGNPGLLTDINQQQTTLTYDDRNRLLSSTTNGITNSWSYTLAGELETTTDGENRTNTFTYDTTYGRLIRITDPLSNYLHYDYDSQGNLIKNSAYNATNIIRRYQEYSYQHPDHPGKLWKIINPNLAETVFNYDDMGNVNSVTDALARITTYNYDHWNRLQQINQPGPTVTSHDYDSQGNLTTVTDATSKLTTYVYDDLGRLLSETSPDTGTTRYAYDAAGNLISQTNADSITVTFGYDTLGRLTTAAYPDATQNIANTYDEGANGKGRITTVTDPSGTTGLQYDGLARLAQENKTIFSRSFAIAYSYDNSGVLTGMTYPSGRTITYGLDANGQVTAIQTTYNSQTTTLGDSGEYEPFGPLKSLTLGNGRQISKTYDFRYLVQQIQAGTMDYLICHDAVGNVEAVLGAPVPELPTDTKEYTYSAGTNRLSTITGGQTAQYTYDNHGNITSDDTRTFTYNQNNRLIKVSEGATILAEYFYDAAGRRVKKTASSATTLYIYDKNSNLISETDESGTPLKDYIYLNGEPFAMAVYGAQAGIYYFFNDHLGTPQMLVDETGAIVWQAAYLPFGEAHILVETVTNNFRFPGQYYDEETGNHYNWHRYYDPSTGRYLTPDPIGLNGGMNLFLYASANPINEIDPWGLASCTYSISKHTMVCTSNTSQDPSFIGPDERRQVGPDGVFSGRGECRDEPSDECLDNENNGPVVPRNYNMNEDNRPGHENWWRLEPSPKIPGWKVRLGLARGGFAFHLGSRSAGCITANKNNPDTANDFSHLHNLLKKEKGSNTLTVTQ